MNLVGKRLGHNGMQTDRNPPHAWRMISCKESRGSRRRTEPMLLLHLGTVRISAVTERIIDRQR
jgi:hypothetical protein